MWPKFQVLLALLLLDWLTSSCTRPKADTSGKRIIVLGIDGMDPGFLEKHWEALPELDRLRREGDFKRLMTTMPPQSPVAWSTVITGLDPGGHGIYDFIHRNPDTMLPVSSMAQASQGGRQVGLGPYLLPLTRGKIEVFRHGVPFWKILADAGVPATVLRMPTDFPPVECDAHSLSGMGTPDLRGTFGTFAFFTDDDRRKNQKITGGEIFPVHLQNSHAVLHVPGPVNSLRKDQLTVYLDIEVFVDPQEPVARFDLGGKRITLTQGEWSNWIPVRFPLIGGLATAEGIFRIYVKQLHPRLEIYVSPINIDPASPAMPISQPRSYSATLSEQIGPFYTQGMPYDTAALRHGVFTRAEYLAHSRQVSEQTLDILRSGLDQFRGGILFFHFFGIDQDSHMLWGRYEDELLDTYKLVDHTLGWVRRKAKDATLIVLSDHGFARFDRAVHLNMWLMREGFLALATGEADKDAAFANVDWSHTKAYSLGLNGVYINQQFRERDGIVAEGAETEKTVEEIRSRLLGFVDPKSGQLVVRSVVVPRKEFHGEALNTAPDLLIGYTPGYRSSWQTALGGVPGTLIEDNTDEWRGDHCIDASSVPGVLLSNHKISQPAPRLEDIPVTILAQFGINKTNTMRGRNLYAAAVK